MNTLVVKVEKKTQEAQDIVSFELASADGKPLPPFSAGSHIDVHVGAGLVRQYSLCNDSTESHRYQIAVLRDPDSRGGSVAVHENVNVGDLIQISEPRNHFPLAHAGHYLLLAGGIGVTPILCMAERLAKIGASFEMHYCSRSPERTAFRERIQAAPFADRVQLHFDNGAPGQKLELDKVLAAASPGTHIYVCGPAGFIEFVTGSARSHGWPADRVHLEYFGAAPQDTTGDTAFEVTIASSGQRYTIPADKSVCAALLEHGIDIPISCEQGVCGTCITRVLEGTPDHRDVYFTDEEKALNDQFTPCCSRARTKLLVLDL
ncbi:MAG: PDR/VanB family oxidoreductase [Telluria sp.]